MGLAHIRINFWTPNLGLQKQDYVRRFMRFMTRSKVIVSFIAKDQIDLEIPIIHSEIKGHMKDVNKLYKSKKRYLDTYAMQYRKLV